jgi:hypothetical protein
VGPSETEEYQRIDGVWCDESGLPIDVEALMRVAGVDCLAFCSEVWARTVTARTLASKRTVLPVTIMVGPGRATTSATRSHAHTVAVIPAH